MLCSPAQWARQELLPRLSFAHIAAALLTLASGLANVRYGYSLGHDTLDKLAMAGASIGADLALFVGLTIIAGAVAVNQWGKAGAMTMLFLVSLIFSSMAGLNFSAEVRGEHLGQRAAAERTDTTRVNELARIDARIKELGKPRTAGELKAQMDAILADRRANSCKEMNGPYTKENCPRYFQLKGEHERAVELGQLVAKRQPLVDGVLKTDIVVTADPAASNIAVYLAKLGIDVNPANIPPWQNLLFVVLVVLGGPIMLWLAEARVPAREQNEQTPPPAKPEPKPEPVPEPKPEQPANDNTATVVVRPRKVASVTPVGEKTIKRLEKLGGVVQSRSQQGLAEQLGLPRTSLRRVLDQLEASEIVVTSHDLAGGYKIALAA